MAMHDIRQALGAAIGAHRDQLVELTRALIRFPTVNPPGDVYRECAEFIGARLARSGFAIEYVRALGAPGDCDARPRVNLVARREGGTAGPCLHFNGHIDVVPPGLGWSVEPFAATVQDGRIYGRGSCDMKGGIAAAIVACEVLIEAGLAGSGALEISATADEESGGYGGVAYLAERGYFSAPRVTHVIIPEPLNVDRVCIGHRGVWWAELETLGRVAHGSMPFLGDCAVRHMAAVLALFEQELWPALRRRTTRMPVVPDGARHSTLSVNSLHGGQAEGGDALPSPCVVDSCRMILDRRFLAEESLSEVKAEMRALLERLAATRPGFRYRMKDLFEVLPTLTDQDRPVVIATRQAIAAVLGREATIVCSPGTYDQKHIDRIGRLKDCIAYGPGILDLAHQPDEYVAIEDLLASAQVMACAAYTLLAGSV